MTLAEQFNRQAELKAFDIRHRNIINYNISKYEASVQKGLAQYLDHDLARSRAEYIKTHTIENLDKYLIEFEQKFTANGGKVIWAETKQDALDAIEQILNEVNATSVVKSKSMTTEEIHLNEFLEAKKIEVIETDLGEYIVQLAGQKPYHIVTPAMHLSKKDISDIFVEKLHIAPTDDAQELTLTARRLLREKYTSAQVGITGANFLIADVGGIAITENEGNARLSVTFPKVHIAIAGIEKIIPKLTDLDLFWSLLATSGTGQRLTVYNSVITAPRKAHEKDGAEQMYVILLDNGRTQLLADTQKRQALNCIRCGACLNACPVYKNIGGHTYQTTYSGPIGSVITPHYEGMKKFKHLSFASSLCGACTSVCPVRINIHNLLLLNRKESVEKGYVSKSEKWAMQLLTNTLKSRKKLDFWSSKLKNFAFQKLFKRTWGKRRTMPRVAPKSFSQLWKEQQKKQNIKQV
ncbi:MAG: LutB/LldF family L-lactate oxidation iron-sulfur protein [Microscillaceae bacterium]|nr:LutB/LldF family L-lactate oxidation iron-sulfur protein [Microscillaceae bacterium]MDW8460990.1 LutB/LldF family L-lactate oxidation iron-sulfur protein [Cytophagales bacterium]